MTGLLLFRLLLQIYAYNIAALYFASYPRFIALACALLTFGYQTLDAIDGTVSKHICLMCGHKLVSRVFAIML